MTSAAFLFLRFPRPYSYMAREINALRKRLPKGARPTFHSDRSVGLLIPFDRSLEQLYRQIDRELEPFDDWDLLEIGRSSLSKNDSGVVETWMRQNVRFLSGEPYDDPETDWAALAEVYRNS